MTSPHTPSDTSVIGSIEFMHQVSKVVEEIGNHQFYKVLVDFVRNYCSTEYVAVWLHKRNSPPVCLYRPYAAHPLVSEYVRDGYRFALSYFALCSGIGNSTLWLKEGASGYYFSPYLRNMYGRIGLKDSVDILCSNHSNSIVTVWIQKKKSSCGAGEVDQLRRIQPFVSTAIDKHIQQCNSAREQIATTIANFGKNSLTRREHQIVSLMLMGHSSRAIANLLYTAENTIKIHRKNIHRKLNVTSQAELLSLVLKCIPYSGAVDAVDPYFAYLSSHANIQPIEHA